MDFSRFIVFLLFFILISSSSVGFDLQGDGPETPQGGGDDWECVDGADNDDPEDTKKDSNDPGCVEPYRQDDEEGNVIDYDATWVFSREDNTIDNTDPSVYYGWNASELGSTTFKDEANGNDGIKEYYVENPDKKWGGGEVKYKPVQVNDGSNTDSIHQSSYEIIDNPEKPNSDCGNSIDDGSGEDNFNCPEDTGLPDDPGSYHTTESESSETMTKSFNDAVGQWDVTNKLSIGDSGDDTTDYVAYVMNLSATEHNTSEDEDISGKYDGSPSSPVVYEDRNWKNVPDYYHQNEDEIWVVYPKITTNTKISDTDNPVKDYDLTKGTYTDYDSSSNTIDDNCSESHVNLSCGTTGSDKCTSTSSNSVTDHDLNTDNNVILSASTEKYETSTSKPGYTKVTTSYNWEVNVTYDKEGTSHSVEATDCSTWEKDETCSSSGDTDGETCSFDSATVYVDTATDEAPGASNNNYNPGTTSGTVTYKWEDISLKNKKVFDINPAEDPSNSPSNPKTVLFQDDTFHGTSYSSTINRNSYNGDAYWSYSVGYDSKLLGNDPAISSSSFKVRIDGEKFVSVRNFNKSWDADGYNGQSDGYIAFLHPKDSMQGSKSIEGSTNNFAGNETKTGGNPAVYLSKNDIYESSHSCPDPFSYCIAAVDFRLDNLNGWTNPTDPDTGISYDTEIHSTNESIGVCMMWKKLNPGTEQIKGFYQNTMKPSQERCLNDNPPPTNCTDNDPACNNNNPDLKILMEGPEIDESVVDDDKDQFQTKVDETTDCNLRDFTVEQGTIADVSTSSYPGYELDVPSPDMEICLNIDMMNTNGPGDDRTGDNYDFDNDGNTEELGGEWWDLDNERVNQYLRNNGGHLVDLSSKVNSSAWRIDSYGFNDVDYYWRENRNPNHNEYNPKGGKKGIALEDDCGPKLDGCDDQEANINNKNPVFYTFFLKVAN